jgi:hypothetical protein
VSSSPPSSGAASATGSVSASSGGVADAASENTDGASGSNASSGASGGSSSGSAGSGSDDAGSVPVSDAAAASAEGGAPFPGMMSLFDGTTLNGWMQSPKNWWSVKAGTIDGQSTSGGEIIVTNADYGDFRLIVSSRMPLNMGGGHLGICFWGNRTMPPGGYGQCKLYIPPNPWSWDYLTNGGLKNATYTTTMTQDPSVWHRTELLCTLATGHCLAAVDGKLMMTYDEQKLSTIRKGPIGLQIHAGNSEVQYKDVYVDPAPANAKLLTVP